jgi:hypothetical protein
MNHALRVAGVLALIVFVVAPGAAFAGISAPELDPSLTIGGLALLGGTAAFVIERYRRRTK